MASQIMNAKQPLGIGPDLLRPVTGAGSQGMEFFDGIFVGILRIILLMDQDNGLKPPVRAPHYETDR